MSEAVISFPFLGLEINPRNYITIFGRNVYFYGIIIAVGLILAAVYACKRAPQFGLKSDDILDMLIWAVPSGIIGARLYYVIFNFDVYRDNFGDIVKIWEGGLAIYGGIIGAAIALVIVCRVKKVSTCAMLDEGGLGLMIGQAIGRWGNFFNREAFGSETDVFCKMGLTTSSGTIYVHPTFLYESLWNVIGFIILHIYSKKKRKYDGQIFLMYLAWYGLGRFFIEGLRTDSLYLFGTGIRVSQLLAAVTFVIATVLLIYNSRRHKPEEMFVNVVKARQTTADAEKAETSEKVADEAEAPYENFDKNIKTTEENTLLNKKDSNEEEL